GQGSNQFTLFVADTVEPIEKLLVLQIYLRNHSDVGTDHFGIARHLPGSRDPDLNDSGGTTVRLTHDLEIETTEAVHGNAFRARAEYLRDRSCRRRLAERACAGDEPGPTSPRAPEELRDA